MGLTVLRYDVEIPMDSGLPEDVAVNTFHVLADDDFSGGAENAAAAILDVYTGLHGEPNAVGSLLSHDVDRTANAASITAYSLIEAPPRQPFYGPASWTVPAQAGNTALPAEVALCVSYQAVPLSGFAQARRRGRFFVGPFNDIAIDLATGLPRANTIEALREAGEELLTSSNAAADPAAVPATGWKWVVYSPTIAAVGTNTPLDAWALVDNGWVDNAWDTQRRRGVAATARSVF